MNEIIILKKDGFLVAAMPNGDIIPKQLSLKVSSEVDNRNMCTVTVTCLVDINNLPFK